jgi:7-cyano-7-deazaguanine reductase
VGTHASGVLPQTDDALSTPEACVPLMTLAPPNQQGLDIQATPREEMNLYPLDTFPYEFAGKEIKINFEIPEFTCICPFSDFPDFATIRLEYVPNEHCIELKSLKLYINSFREVKVFHEHVINLILEDFVNACDPLSVEIDGDFNVRGNIKTTVKASYRKAAGSRQ